VARLTRTLPTRCRLTVDGVTPAWLSAALRTRYPDVVVTVAERFEVVEGTATKLLFALRYDGNDGCPAGAHVDQRRLRTFGPGTSRSCAPRDR
jgi:hypothetical protein